MNELKGWSLEGDSISKEIKFASFREAIDYVNKISEIAEQKNHHPDILITYDIVRLVLTTHHENGLTEKDFEVAKMIDGLG